MELWSQFLDKRLLFCWFYSNFYSAIWSGVTKKVNFCKPIFLCYLYIQQEGGTLLNCIATPDIVGVLLYHSIEFKSYPD